MEGNDRVRKSPLQRVGAYIKGSGSHVAREGRYEGASVIDGECSQKERLQQQKSASQRHTIGMCNAGSMHACEKAGSSRNAKAANSHCPLPCTPSNHHHPVLYVSQILPNGCSTAMCKVSMSSSGCSHRQGRLDVVDAIHFDLLLCISQQLVHVHSRLRCSMQNAEFQHSQCLLSHAASQKQSMSQPMQHRMHPHA